MRLRRRSRGSAGSDNRQTWFLASWPTAHVLAVETDPTDPRLVTVCLSLRSGRLASFDAFGAWSGTVWARDVVRRLPLQDMARVVLDELADVAARRRAILVTREWSEHNPAEDATQWTERIELPTGSVVNLALAGSRPVGQSVGVRRLLRPLL